MDSPSGGRSREQGWPWPIHAFLGFIAAFLVFFESGDWSAHPVRSAMIVVPLPALMAWNLLSRRRVDFSSEGLTIAGVFFPWEDLHAPHFRGGPPARCAMCVRLTDEARTRRGMPPAAHARRPGDDEGPFDFVLRAHGERLARWRDWAALGVLGHARTVSTRALERLQGGPGPLGGSPVEVRVQDSGTTLLLELTAPSVDALLTHAQRSIAAALPSEVRWDPSFQRNVLVHVGPVSLGKDPRADAALEHVTAAVKASLAGAPASVGTFFAQRG